MSQPLYLALLHHPVYDKNGAVVTTALTPTDIHDIARAARTYGVRRFYVVTPIEAVRRLAERIVGHWLVGHGATYNTTRKEALEIVSVVSDLDRAIVDAERDTGIRLRVVATSARGHTGTEDFRTLRERLAQEPHLLLLGTGWGLAAEVIRRADALLEPVRGPTDYNHLSVRTAAAVILDRLRANR